MTSDRWREIKNLLADTLEVPAQSREHFLGDRCGEDAELRREVESLLAFEDSELEVFEHPLVDLLAGRDPEPRVGERAGPFKLVSEIARGGMGIVYRAERVEGGFQQTVAIKILRHGFDRGDFIRRARQERRILARLDHPNVARLLDGGTTEDGLPFLVMELVEGETLDVHRERDGFSLDQGLTLFLKICEVVQLAHQNLIVHCDLKPSNILVKADGEPKLLDFGIAKVLREDSVTRTLALRLGTPGYASPEQMEGGNISTAADLYALGGVLFLLLSGRAPRKSKGAEDRLTGPLVALARQRGKVGARRISSRGSEGDLDAIVAKAMAWDPSQRYGSVGELIDDLRRHLEQRPISAKSYNWWGDLRLTARRRGRELRIASVLLALALFAGFTGMRLKGEARLNATRAEQTLSALEEFLTVFDPASSKSPAEAVRSTVAKLKRILEMQAPIDRAFLLDRMGRLLYRNGFSTEARQPLREALELRRLHQPGDWEKVAASLNNLALVEKDLGHLEESVEHWKRLRELHERNKGLKAFDYGEYLAVVSNLARGLQDLGQLAEAEALDRRVLADKIRIHGDEHLKTMESRANLGQLLVRMGRWTEAEHLLRRVVDYRIRVLGRGAEKTLVASSNLGALWLSRGETDRAIKTYREILRRRLEIYGSEHLRIAASRSALGRALLERGSEQDLSAADLLLHDALEIYSKNARSGSDHALWTRRHLAALRLAQGESFEAEGLLRSILEVELWTKRRNWHAAELRSLLGECLLGRGALGEARPLLEASLPVIVRRTGESSLYGRAALRRWQLWQKAAAAAANPRAAQSPP